MSLYINSTLRPSHVRIWLPIVIVSLGIVYRIPFLFSSLNEAFNFRQTQTAFPVQIWLESGFRPLLPSVPVFGEPYEFPLEFPLFQWLAFGVAQLVPSVDIAMRVTGLLVFQFSAILLFLLARNFFGSFVALSTLVIYEFNPYTLKWGTASLIDFTIVALILLSLLLLRNGLSTRRHLLFALALFSSALAFSLKPMTVICWSPIFVAIFYLHVSQKEFKGCNKLWKKGASSIGIALLWLAVSGVPFLIWNAWAGSVRLMNPDAAAVTQNSLMWMIGNMSDRSPVAILRVIQSEYSFVLGGVVIALFLATVSYRKLPKDRLIIVAFALVPVVPLIFFTRLFAVHDYYSIAVVPAVAILAGIGSGALLRGLDGHNARRPVLRSSIPTSTILGAAWISYLVTEGLQINGYEAELAGVVGAFFSLLFFGFGVLVLKSMDSLVFPKARLAGAAFVVSASIFGLLMFPLWKPVLDPPMFTREIALLSTETAKSDAVLSLGCDSWNPTAFYYAARGGLMLGIDGTRGVKESVDFSKFDVILICQDGNEEAGARVLMEAASQGFNARVVSPGLYRLS